MRLLFVNHASRLSGAELVLLDIVKGFHGASAFLFEDGPLRPALAAAGIITVLPAAPTGFSAIKRDRSLWRAFPHLRGLAAILCQVVALARRSDVVYANSQKAFALAAPACALARRKLIWHLHDILSTDHFGAGQIRLTIALSNCFAAGVIVPSQAAAAAFTAAGGRHNLLRIVPNGLDDPTETGSIGKDPHGLATEFVFGVFSRLAPWKGQAVALRALQAMPKAGCIIVGGALFGEDDYARSLVSLADELGVTDRVRFLGHRSDVAALMRSVDAVVHPSVDPEPFGRTLVEAMLARRPVIAANAGAVPEILDGSRFGMMFPPGDAAALAACLARVMAGEAAPLIDVAEQRARTHYTAARMRAAIAAVVADVAGRAA